MTHPFLAQTSIAQALSPAYAGMVATAVPSHTAHGLNTSRQNVTVTPVAANGAVYTLTIVQFGVSVAYPYTADGSATVAEITAGLVALVNAGTQQVTATDNTTSLSLVNDQYLADYEFAASATASAGSIAVATVTEQAAALADGVFVVFDDTISSDPMAVRLPASSDDVTTSTGVAGVVIADSIARVRLANAQGAPQMVGLLRKGQIYVKVEETVGANDPVYVRYAAGGNGQGSFGAAAGTSERALVNGAVYRQGAAANGIALVEINIIGG